MSNPPPTPYLAPIMRGWGLLQRGIGQMIFVSLPRASYATSDPYELHLVYDICPTPRAIFLRISPIIPPSSPQGGVGKMHSDNIIIV